MYYQEIERLEIHMEQWEKTVDLQLTYQNISAVRIRWLQYTTESSNHRTLAIACNELGNAGRKPNDDNSNTKYLITLPIDPGFPVTCTYGNFTDTFDKTYLVPIDTNQLSFKVYIDGRPATTDVTEDSPVVFEIAFYKHM
jgi:hypothetical protein